ncbi:MAG: hypothetical protein ABEI06_06325 [Halobacteriaceae archaeon]
MANLNAALNQIRKTRQQLDVPRTQNFDNYRANYKTLLEATETLTGDEGFEELKEWIIQVTENRKRLPTPSEVQDRARIICHDRSVDIPRSSPLYSEDSE